MVGRKKGSNTPIDKEPESREILHSKHFSERARELLREPHLGVLAVLRADGGIVQTEMWYDLKDDDRLLMNTTKFRRKYGHLRGNPFVSFFVSRGTQQYVTLNGTVILDDDPVTSQADIRRLAKRYLGEEAAEKIMQEEFSRQERVSIVVTPTRITEYFSQ